MSFKRAVLLLLATSALGASCDETVNNGGVSLAVTERVSLTPSFLELNGQSRNAALTPDGRWLAFESHASDLVPGDTNARADIFVRDMLSGAVTRVSVSTGGLQGDQDSLRPAISANGRYVVFQTESATFGGSDGQHSQIYVHDRNGPTTTMMSEDAFFDQAFGDCFDPTISADGAWVAFVTKGSNLHGVGDTVGRVVRRPRTTPTFVTVPNSTGVDHATPSISDSGDAIAYTEMGVLSVPQVRRRRIGAAATDTVSYDWLNAGQGNGPSGAPKISANGQFVVFASAATNISVEYGAGVAIMLRDMTGGPSVVVSRNSANEPTLADCAQPWISPDARYVAFSTIAGNLDPGDTNFAYDVYVRDRQAGLTVRASVRTFGNQAQVGTASGRPCVPADGSFVVFESSSPTLVDDDTNGVVDLFIRRPLW